jgi:hypothetical protein
MNKTTHAVDLIAILSVNATAYTLAQFNALLGAFSLSLSVAYTAYKFYKELKQKK